ncbi:BnaCnng23480D [Brassica napus]|uniref:BnaCnng23480D protein n=1 Tax=Brassica napus TaxID=3708 RepID=A0A078ITP4_BRANA|nr:BnaCnng23480D [Brassica napus]
MALLPLPPSVPMNQDLVFSLARRRWMFASVLLNPLDPRDPPDPPDPPDPTVTSQSKPPSSSSLRDLHQTPPHSSPPISLPSISTSGFRASCFFHEIYYRGSRTETTQICLTEGGAFLSIVHVSPSSSTTMVLVCSGERNAPSVDGSSSSNGGLSFHSDSGETLIGSSFVKDRISFESPLTASYRNLISISKQLRLQPDYSKSHCLLSDAYSLTLNGNEYDDSLLKFLRVTISWPRHGNVKVRASDPIKPYTSSPNSIVLSSSKVKLELEIHLVSWVSLAVFRAVRVRFNDKSRQLRPFDTIAVEIDAPASLSTRGGSFLVFKPVLNSSKSLSLGYFNVVSDYLKLFRAVVSRIQAKIFCRSLYFEQASPLNTSISCVIALLLLFLFIVPSKLLRFVIVETF